MPTEIIYSGIRYLDIGEVDEIHLADGLTLVKPSSLLLSGRMRYAQNEHQYEEAEKASRYLVYRYKNPVIQEVDEFRDPLVMFYGGLMALQIVKPVKTLGFKYTGTDYGNGSINAAIEALPPMEPGEWARLKSFDSACLSETINLVPRVQKALEGAAVPAKNAITTLQLGLETYGYHHYIAGLLWVMGLEAIFDSKNRGDFSQKLCDLLGENTRAFPDWATVDQPPQWTVKDIAVDLYMLRNKLAHGVDLRSAANDKSTPVDLLRNVRLHGYSYETSYARLLCEAACYLLCSVIRQTI